MSSEDAATRVSRWCGIARVNVAAVRSLGGIALVCLGAYGDKNRSRYFAD
jgi:hypothetical protein